MKNYTTFLLSEEPKILGIPITTGIPLLGLTLIGVVIGHALPFFVLGGGLSVLMHVFFGGLPIRQFWALLYWSLPATLTYPLFRRSPPSYYRLYIR